MSALPTGAELAAEIDALLERRPDISKVRVGLLLRCKRNGVEDLRIRNIVHKATVAKVRALIADPPAEVLKRPNIGYRPSRCARKAVDRRSAAIRTAAVKQAEARIQAGLSSGKAASIQVRLAQRDLERQRAERDRLACPVEQALLKIRRRGRVVFRASVHGGPHDRFIMGARRLTEAEILQLAAQL